MDIAVDYAYKLSRKNTVATPKNTRIIFLCGSVFDKESPHDKRTVLKKHLQNIDTNKVIILEEHFSRPSVYGDIDLENLLDVENLVACFANATVIIHESISTGAELGMLGSSKKTAEKLLVLYPDMDSVEENKLSTFMRLAFFSGANSILRPDQALSFNPRITDHYTSNDRYLLHTAFPDPFDTSSLHAQAIMSFIEAKTAEDIAFNAMTFRSPLTENTGSVDYYLDKDTLCVFISTMALRDLLFALLSLSSARTRIVIASSLSELISNFQTEFEILLKQTAKSQLGIDPKSIQISIKDRDVNFPTNGRASTYRKSIGLFIYLLKALDYLSDDDNKSFKFTNKFASFRNQYESMVSVVKPSAFAIATEHPEMEP